jgi:hypothetical protein
MFFRLWISPSEEVVVNLYNPIPALASAPAISASAPTTISRAALRPALASSPEEAYSVHNR